MRALLRSIGVLAFVVTLVVPVFASAVPAAAQSATCADFDAWPWAQTVMESDPGRYAAAVDPDGNGIACEDLPVNGFAPVLWTDKIPDGAEAAQIVSITDGDTFKVAVNGAVDTVRMYHIDTPETKDPRRGVQCGGPEASAYLAFVLGLAPNGTVYLEYDQTARDKYDRRLAYVWYQIGDDVYMVNEIMVRNGWAESEAYKPDLKYSEQLDAAEQFSIQKVTGVRLLCGRFGMDTGAAPSGQQLREAQQRQPNQGQFDGIVSREALEQQQQPQQPPQVQQPPQAPAPPPAQPAAQQGGECDPSYPGVCIPPVWVQGDLDCKDVSYRRFQVVPPDPHNFDGDFDGVGCES